MNADFWKNFVLIVIGIPVLLIALYIVSRVISAAVLHSWYDMKVKYFKSLLGLKENTEGGKHDGTNG